MCAEHVCAKFKIEHESDLGYGKGYALINNEFYRVLNKLSLLPHGLFLISHSQEKELETRTGKITRIVPTLPEKARKIVLGMVDLILFCDLDPSADGKAGARRVIRTKPSVHYEAGDRTGRLPEVIDLDFGKFVAAYAAGQPPRLAHGRADGARTGLPTSAAARRDHHRPVATHRSRRRSMEDRDDFDLARFGRASPMRPSRKGHSEVPGSHRVNVEKVELINAKTTATRCKWHLKTRAAHRGRFLFRNSMLVTKENIRWLKGDLHLCGLDSGISTCPRTRAPPRRELEVTVKTKGDFEHLLQPPPGHRRPGKGAAPAGGQSDDIPF